MSRDLIYRQDAIDAIIEDKICDDSLKIMIALGDGDKAETLNMTCDRHAKMLMSLPYAESDRDIPRKPIEGCSLSWRKKVKEAGCPNCNFFLSHFRFYGEGKRITYCEHCGQAIDWEGWEWDE